jgi:hypothetical protein
MFLKITSGDKAEVMPTHKTTLCHYTFDRSIIPESFNELSLAVSEIIRGQNLFLKNKIRQYFLTGSDFSKI